MTSLELRNALSEAADKFLTTDGDNVVVLARDRRGYLIPIEQVEVDVEGFIRLVLGR